MILGFVLHAVIWSSKLVNFKYHFSFLHAHKHMHICSSTVKWSVETQGTLQHLSEPVLQRGTRKKKNCEKDWDSICHTGRTRKGTWGEGSFHGCLMEEEEWTWQHWPHKVIFQEERAFLKSDKGSELQLLITRQLKKYRISDDGSYKATSSPPPHVLPAPWCPPTPCAQLSSVDQGKREVRAQNRATVPASPWASAGVSQVARVHVSPPVQGILERSFPSYSWKVSSSQERK